MSEVTHDRGSHLCQGLLVDDGDGSGFPGLGLSEGEFEDLCPVQPSERDVVSGKMKYLVGTCSAVIEQAEDDLFVQGGGLPDATEFVFREKLCLRFDPVRMSDSTSWQSFQRVRGFIPVQVAETGRKFRPNGLQRNGFQPIAKLGEPFDQLFLSEVQVGSGVVCLA